MAAIIRYLGILIFTQILVSHTYAQVNLMKPGNDSLKINVYYDKANNNDTLSLNFINPLDLGNEKAYKEAMSVDGYFHFNVSANSIGCFQIGLETNKDTTFKISGWYEPLLPISYYEPGDNMTIKIGTKKNANKIIFSCYDWFRYSFSGRGSNKLVLMQEVHNIRQKVGDKGLLPLSEKWVFTDPMGQSTQAAYDFLQSRKGELSDTAYWLMQADIVYNSNSDAVRFSGIARQVRKFLGILNSASISMVDSFSLPEKLKDNYNNSIATSFDKYELPMFALKKSTGYLIYVYRKSKMDCFVNYGRQDPDYAFQNILKTYKGEIRDRALLFLLANDYTNSAKLNSEIYEASSIIKTPYCLRGLNELKTRLKGAVAFNFSLPDSKGRMVDFQTYKDKIVVIDFWYTGCGACSSFYQNVLSKVEDKFQGNDNVVFISISIDKIKQIWLNQLHSDRYTSVRAINLNTNGEGANVPIIKHYKVYYYPTFIVIKDSKVITFNTTQLRENTSAFVNLINGLLPNTLAQK